MKWIVCALLLPSVALGQTILGRTVEQSGNAPVPGVVLVLMDTLGRVVARALTDDRGEYRLSTTPGTYRVRTLRIGYRPLVSLPFDLAPSQQLQQSLALTNIPVSLDTIRVAARSACQLLTDTTSATAAVWEQARIALTAAQLSAGSRVMKSTIVRFYRAMDPSAKRTLRETSVPETDYVSKPWRSRSADSLRRFGYTHEEPDGSRTYHAPDLDALLSTQFVEDHCFRLASDRDARDLIGLAFEPTRDRSRIADIKGTLWLDRTSAVLKRLEFNYVNTGVRGLEEAGGAMEFVRIANGAWAISRWNIRMPLLAEVTIPSGGVPGEVSRTELRVREWRISGGDLALLTRGPDTLWSAPTNVTVAAAPPPPSVAAPRPATPTPAPRSDSAVPLRTVEVRSVALLTEFEERRTSGMGHYLTRDQLAKQEARALPDVLLQLPGVRMARDAGRSHLTSGRGVVTGVNEKRSLGRFETDPKRACYADVYMDGSLMYGGKKDETLFDLSTIRPAIIEGIEYYASPATTPVKYSRPGRECGTLLIWTRRR
jgi:hypothetical protein